MSAATREKMKAAKAVIREEKDSITRLMDRTAGWSAFLDRENGEHPDSVSREDVSAVYQAVANDLQEVMDAPEAVKQEAVRAFVEQRVLPLLLKS